MTDHKHEYRQEAIYYYDESRKAKYRCQTCGAKTFAWSRQVAPGVYVKGRGGVDPGLFVSGQYVDRLWIVEGEKDAESVGAAGEMAITAPDGSGSWQDSHTEEIATYLNKPVIIVADADDAGRRHAQNVKASILSFDPDATVSVVEPPGGCKDTEEWLSAGGDLDTLAGHKSLRASLADGLRYKGCKLRDDDPVYGSGYTGPVTWLAARLATHTEDAPEVIANPSHPVDPYSVRVRCGECRGYLMVSLDEGKTRKCWRCRKVIEVDGDQKYIPLVYKCEAQ